MLALVAAFFIFINFSDVYTLDNLLSKEQSYQSEELYNNSLPEPKNSQDEQLSKNLPANNTQVTQNNYSYDNSSPEIQKSQYEKSNTNYATDYVQNEPQSNYLAEKPAEISASVTQQKQKVNRYIDAAIIEAQRLRIIDENTAFYCKTTKGKQILLQLDNDNAIYMFGKNLQQPDIVLKRSVNDIHIDYETYEDGENTLVALSNGSYVYSIDFGSLSDEQNIGSVKYTGSVAVYNKGKLLTEINCDNPNAIYLKEYSQ